MSKDNTQEQLPLRNKIVSCFDGDYWLPNKALNNLDRLVKSEVRSILERLEKQAKTQAGFGAYVPLMSVEAEKAKYE